MNDDKQLFPLGRIIILPAALETLGLKEIQAALFRHERGDWGLIDGCSEDFNNEAVNNGYGIHSTYYTADGREFSVRTEGDRSTTTVLMPSDLVAPGDPYTILEPQLIVLPKLVRIAWQTLMEYLWNDELSSYETSPQDEQKGHIFVHLFRLRSWFEGGCL